MPGPIMTGDELGHGAIALDKKVRRYPQLGGLGKIRMGVAIKCAGEKLLCAAGTELARRQADVVDHQQRNIGSRGARIEMRRRTMPYPSEPTVGRINLHESTLTAKPL